MSVKVFILFSFYWKQNKLWGCSSVDRQNGCPDLSGTRNSVLSTTHTRHPNAHLESQYLQGEAITLKVQGHIWVYCKLELEVTLGYVRRCLKQTIKTKIHFFIFQAATSLLDFLLNGYVLTISDHVCLRSSPFLVSCRWW